VQQTVLASQIDRVQTGRWAVTQTICTHRSHAHTHAHARLLARRRSRMP
jgi:hypothetical protein